MCMINAVSDFDSSQNEHGRTFIYIIIILVISSMLYARLRVCVCFRLFSSFHYLIAICIIKRMIDILHSQKLNECIATVIIQCSRVQQLQ